MRQVGGVAWFDIIWKHMVGLYDISPGERANKNCTILRTMRYTYSLHTVLMFTNIGNEVSQGSERGRLCSICITIFEGGVARKSFVAFFISGGFVLNLVAFTTVLGF